MLKGEELRIQHKEIENILNNYVFFNAEIENLKLKIEEIKLNDFLKSTKCNGALTTTLKKDSKNKIRELNLKKKRLENRIKNIDNVLSILNDKEYKFVELRYFKQLTIKKIAKDFFMAEISILVNRRKILNKLINFKELLL